MNECKKDCVNVGIDCYSCKLNPLFKNNYKKQTPNNVVAVDFKNKRKVK